MSNYTAEQVDHLAGLLRYSGTDEFSDEAADAMDAFATTLRQQSGRVDDLLPLAIEGWNEHQARCRITTVEGSLRAALTAALAQNTQGDGEPVAWMRRNVTYRGVGGRTDGERIISERKVYPDDLPLYLHADRARVPDAMSTDGLSIMSSEFDRREGWNACREAMLAAAAPSQRAEVK